MANILIVDDERYAIEGITKGIQWKEIGITGVYEAQCATEAMDILNMHDIDVILCDIEMPGINGLELIKWARDNGCDCKTIFLTGYADFPYAQNAVKLNSFDYLLKPVEHEQLAEVIRKALSEIAEERELRQNARKYDHYYRIWESNKKSLISNLWTDVINDKFNGDEETLNYLFCSYNLNITASQCVQPVLVSMQFNIKLSGGIEHELERIGLRELAEEIFLAENAAGTIVYPDPRHLCIILYDTSGTADIKKRCEKLVHLSAQQFKMQIVCYVGQETSVTSLPEMMRKLFHFKNNTLSNGSICEYNGQPVDLGRRDKNEIPVEQWRVLLETEDFPLLRMQIYSFFSGLDSASVLPQTIKAFYHAICTLVYNRLQRKKTSIAAIQGLSELISEGQYIHSMEQARDWAVSAIDKIGSFARENEAPFANILKKVQQYINEKDQYYSRETIASLLNLNPDYLSRLFKKETGKSLSSYIITQKIEKARELLKTTDRKISDIAEEVGYTHLSHFALIFRKITGMSPYEYRRKIE